MSLKNLISYIFIRKNSYDYLLWDAFTWNILLCCVCPPEILSVSLPENRLCDSSGLYVPSSNLRLHSSWGIIIILISLNPLPANICFNLLNALLKLTIWRRKTKEKQINYFALFCVMELILWCKSYGEVVSLDVPKILLKTERWLSHVRHFL